jgi:hypothetical protein
MAATDQMPIRVQPCQNLKVPAGTNRIAEKLIRPRKRRTTTLDLRLIFV